MQEESGQIRLNASGELASSWRTVAVRIVDELFRKTSSEDWDKLLDLRQSLLGQGSLEHLLDQFLVCREALEADHYLPFYRLRRLLSESLELEASGEDSHGSPKDLRELLARKHRSFAELKRRIHRDYFEHAISLRDALPALKVVERLSQSEA